MRRTILLLVLASAQANAAAVPWPPPYHGPILQRFFRQGATVDGVPVVFEDWRCWTGTEWLPFADPGCQQAIFHGRPPGPIPQHQRRME